MRLLPRVSFRLLVPLLLVACATRPARTPDGIAAVGGDVTSRLTARIAQSPGAVVRIAARRLDGRGTRITLLGDSLVHAASTMKVPVMIALAQAADRGVIALDSAVTLTNRFASIVDGSTYTLGRDDDSDDPVYERVGTDVPIRWLATRMITHSSNLATNMLMTVVRADTVTAITRRLGTRRMLVLRGVEDTPAFNAGLNNVTTANDLAAVFEAIATDRAASKASCEWMRSVLLQQFYNGAIPAGLPAGTRVAHKTGDITAVEHDAAIVYPAAGAPYVIVVLTSGVRDRTLSQQLIADLTRIVHAEMQR